MKPNIYAFSGSIGSGKSTLSFRLSKELNCKYASFGDYVRKQAIMVGISNPTRAQLQEIGERLISNGVKDFCQAVLQDIGWESGKPLVIDGVRHFDVLENLSKIFYPHKLFLIYLEVDEKTRIDRLVGRGRDEILQEEAEHSTEIEVRETLREKADCVVNSSFGVEDNIQSILVRFGEM